jgi:hypothetical protein
MLSRIKVFLDSLAGHEKVLYLFQHLIRSSPRGRIKFQVSCPPSLRCFCIYGNKKGRLIMNFVVPRYSGILAPFNEQTNRTGYFSTSRIKEPSRVILK